MATVSLTRAAHKADSYFVRTAGLFYTADLEYTRGDWCGLYVVKESGREIGAVRSVVRARDVIERRLSRNATLLSAELPE